MAILKKTFTFALCASLMISMCSCASKRNSKDNLETGKILQQNDYMGTIFRTMKLKENTLSVIDEMKSNNSTIRADSPNSYWNTDGYQDFVIDFLNQKIIDDTSWFNEETYDWQTTVKKISSTKNSFTKFEDNKYKLGDGVYIARNEKDDYSIYGNLHSNKFEGTVKYNTLYDCDKDWAKSVETVKLSNAELPTVTEQLFEYGRLSDNTFAIQTSRERLFIVLEPTEEDKPIGERVISEFYYSKLIKDGARTTFTPFKERSEIDTLTGEYSKDNQSYNSTMNALKIVNENGDLADRYGANDSMFLKDSIDEITPEWVFEDMSLQQAIVYKNGNLVVTTYNKLSEKYERFIYSLADADENMIPEMENMVNIKNLVGVREIPASIKDENDMTEDFDDEDYDEEMSDDTSSGYVSDTSSSVAETSSSVAENSSSSSSQSESSSSSIAEPVSSAATSNSSESE